MKETPEGSARLLRRRRATLRTISELTGLSPSTVSLSLRGGTSLKGETHRKVAEAAAQLGYVPDRAGVRLRTGKTNVIVLVLDGADDSIDFARQMIQGIGATITDTRYHLTVTPVFDRQSVETIRYIVANRTADGVIITHTSARDPRVQLLMDNDFPFVTHGRTEFFAPHPFHDFHSEEFVRLAMERMVAKGAKSVMLVIGGDTTYNYHNIVAAFERAGTRLHIETEVLSRKHDRAVSAEMRQLGRDIASRPQSSRRHHLRQRDPLDLHDCRPGRRRRRRRPRSALHLQADVRHALDAPPRDRHHRGGRLCRRRRAYPPTHSPHRRRAGGEPADAERADGALARLA